FGLARGKALPGITLFGTTVGTPHYMSPEQARGKPTDARSDIYSIGVVAFEMLTGGVLFDAPSPMAVALKQVEEPVPLEVLPSHGVPRALADVIHKCLAKAPEQRFQSAAELETALALLGRVEPEPPAPPALEPAIPSAPSDAEIEEADDVRELMEAVAEGTLGHEIPSDLQFDVGHVAPTAREETAEPPVAEPVAERPSAPVLGRSKASVMRRPTLTGAPAPARDRPPRVLVVDDEPAVRRLMKSALEGSGCETLEAVTGQSALEILHDRGADLVV